MPRKIVPVVIKLRASTTLSRHTNTAKLGRLPLKYSGCDFADHIRKRNRNTGSITALLE